MTYVYLAGGYMNNQGDGFDMNKVIEENTISTQPSNPLTKFFRQPKIYLSLPSQGKYYPNNSLLKTDNNQYPVFPMTARDELTIKTPDALINGQATVDVIQSCIPNIKDAWFVPSIDLDAILVAIRIATYGEKMDLTTKTPITKEEKTYQVDLRIILDQFMNVDYESKVELEYMTINLKPLTYKEFTQNSLKTFEEQRVFALLNNNSISETEKMKKFNESFKKLTELTLNMIYQSIESIDIENETVTNTKWIEEFIKNSDKDIFQKITKHLENEKNKFTIKPLEINATIEEIEKGVPEKYEVPITFDSSNFFA